MSLPKFVDLFSSVNNEDCHCGKPRPRLSQPNRHHILAIVHKNKLFCFLHICLKKEPKMYKLCCTLFSREGSFQRFQKNF